MIPEFPLHKAINNAKKESKMTQTKAMMVCSILMEDEEDDWTYNVIVCGIFSVIACYDEDEIFVGLI